MAFKDRHILIPAPTFPRSLSSSHGVLSNTLRKISKELVRLGHRHGPMPVTWGHGGNGVSDRERQALQREGVNVEAIC